jgi:hypothetical protein
MSPGAQNMKTGPDALGTTENDSGTQNMKTCPDVVGTAENESVSAKHENGTRRPRYHRKWDPTPSIPPKMSLGAQNMKTGPDTLGTCEN